MPVLPSDDPGWPSGAALLFFLFLVPGARQRYERRHRSDDGLIILRGVFLNFSVSLVLFGVALAFLDTHTKGAVLPWLPLLAAAAVVSVGVVAILTNRPLDCSSPTALAAAYRARMFVTIAFTEQVALFGFVFAFIGGPKLIYDLGAAFALLRLWTSYPPTRAQLMREQEKLAAHGCDTSLIAALRAPRPPR
jgi:hypothetical protein